MLRLLLLLVVLGGLSCSKDRPPTAPAGKSTSDYSDLFDLFNSLQESDGDTASDSTASSSPDSSSSSDSTSSAPDSLVFSPTAAVAIPDAALRRYLEKVLKKHRGATITQADMSSLVNLLNGNSLGIKSLIGLEAATNLQNVAMGGNQIADVTPLVHLPKLRYLYLKGNPLSDASIDEHIPALERRGVVVSPSYLASPDTVLIPDVALRTSIEVALKKRRRQPITQAELETLTHLTVSPDHADGLKAQSLIGLEAATNLQTLDLRDNVISDVAPLADLPNLQTLDLRDNVISDVAPLADLPNLQTLDLRDNVISDVAPLADLPNLQTLDLRDNVISDVAPLADLPNLQTLDLRDNVISDVAPLADLPKLRYLYLRGNPPLSDASINEHVPALRRRGVELVLSPYDRTFADSPFDIELVFLDYFTEEEQEIWHRAARRWEEVIQEDIPDFTYPNPQLVICGDHDFTIPAGDQVDDLRVYLTKQSLRGAAGILWYHTSENLDTGTFSDYRCIGIDPEYSTRFEDIWYIGLHEIGHAMGIGSNRMDRSDMLRDLHSADAHFAGPQAIAAFDQAGGRDYQGPKVPLQKGGGHWHGGVLAGELMAPQSSGGALSAITLGMLSDLGYTVDFSMADPYELPPPGAAKPVADAVPFYSVEMKMMPAPVYVDD